MKTIVTMTLNPAIDKSASVDLVVAERKLYCKPPRFEPGGGGRMPSGYMRAWFQGFEKFYILTQGGGHEITGP